VRLDPIDFDDGSTDNCSDNLTYIVSRQNFNCGNLNVTQLIPFWVRDEAGNLSEPCISSVDVIDNLPPVANCVSSLTAALDDNGELTLTPEQFDAGSSDNCGQGNLWMSISPASFDCDYLGSNIVTLNVEDDSGNRSSCETTLQLETETSPQLVCQDITVTLDENNAVTVSPAELIVDEIVGCYPLTERSVSPADFGPEDIGPNEVVVTVRNGLEETATCNVTVKVAANVLPVTWLDFTATLTDDKAAILNWSTATETDNDYFVVEHGTDGTGFATIAFQQGNGSTGLENHYAYTHLDPATGWNYYRLRQVDLDGTASYSTTVAVQLVNSSSSELTVFPNPVHDRVQLRFEELKQMGTVRIYASSGRLLSTQNLAVGRSSLHVETSTWPAGVYAVEMVVGAQRTVKRMIKLD
ncbi:MAG: T9SS type A sorting domain-containing protein, partial [Bacteroidota bacterium]